MTDDESGRPARPGKVLRQILDARGMTQRDLAKATGKSQQMISELIVGKRGITAQTALRLESALGGKALFWLDMQSRWNLYQARRKQSDD
jgi:addiction module HigA family antidote